MTTFIVIDTETTGFEPSIHGLLTLSYKVVKEFPSGERVSGDTKTLYVAFDPDRYQVDPVGLQVNGITIEEHNARPDLLSVEDAGDAFRRVIQDNTTAVFGAGTVPPVVVRTIKPSLIGHNVKFDIGFLYQIVPDLGALIDHGDQDTKVIVRYLQRVGIIPADLSNRLQHLAPYFGIRHDAAHTSSSDVDATEALDHRLVQIGHHLRALLTFSGTEPHLRHAVARQDEDTVKAAG